VSDVIELRELRVSAIVGVLTHERVNEQPLELDIDIERPFVASEVAREGEYLLLETLARRVASAILALDDAITRVTVAVRKLRPPVPDLVATVGVRCSLTR
jgi:dihydroneopterin aldolase